MTGNHASGAGRVRAACGTLALAAAVAQAPLTAGTLDIDQGGSDGSIAVSASSEFALFDVGIEQGGRGNALELDVGDALRATLRQVGDDGTIALEVHGTDALLDVLQSGQGNALRGTLGGRGAHASVNQGGNDNALEFELGGHGAALAVEQSGNDNSILFESAGGGAVLRQSGSANRLEVGGLGPATSVDVTQSGHGGAVTITP